MKKEILDFYRDFSVYTNPGLYKNFLKKDLPNDIKVIGNLVIANRTNNKTFDTAICYYSGAHNCFIINALRY